MCMQCGCRAHPLIVRYMAEHDEVLAGLRVLERAADAGDVATATATAHEIAPALIEHNQNEEIALFPAVSSTGSYVDLVEELTRDHGYLRETIPLIEAGDLSLVPTFVRRLRAHIHNENNGLFPGAEFTLSAQQWESVQAATP